MKKIGIFVLLGGIIWLGCRYFYYGSTLTSCIYTEESISVPKELSEGKVVLFRDAYLATGKDSTYACLPEIGSIISELVGAGMIENLTIGKGYFERNGQKIVDIKAGSREFQIKQMIAVTKHGITTIDSGGGPIKFLVLTDDQGASYKIATVLTGINDKDRFLKLVSSKGETVISPNSFGR